MNILKSIVFTLSVAIYISRLTDACHSTCSTDQNGRNLDGKSIYAIEFDYCFDVLPLPEEEKGEAEALAQWDDQVEDIFHRDYSTFQQFEADILDTITCFYYMDICTTTLACVDLLVEGSGDDNGEHEDIQ